jgi:hypothetical protein
MNQEIRSNAAKSTQHANVGSASRRNRLARWCVAIGLLGTSVAGIARAATWESYTCTPSTVSLDERGNASYERVTVACTGSGPNGSGSNTIQYFAVGTGNAGQAARYLTLATSAIVSGRKLQFFYNHTSNTAGCATSNCRTPYNAAIASP